MNGENQFISLRKAADLLGANRTRINALIKDGTLTVRQIPGGYPQVSRAEIQELSVQSTRPGRLANSVA